MRGARQPGLAKLIFRMRLRMSWAVQGRPWRTRLFQVQYSRNPLRLQAMTVSAFMIRTQERQPCHKPDNQTTRPRRLDPWRETAPVGLGWNAAAREADGARPGSQLATQHGSEVSSEGKKKEGTRSSAWETRQATRSGR